MMGIFALALLGQGREQFWTAIAEAAVLAGLLHLLRPDPAATALPQNQRQMAVRFPAGSARDE